jgi:hypothetical protein
MELIVLAIGLLLVLAFFLSRLGSRKPGRTIQRAVELEDQMQAVRGARFLPVKLMNGAEYKVFKIIEDTLTKYPGHRVMAQVNVGQIIRHDDRYIHSAINSKRVDLVVIDRNGYVKLVVEVQGHCCCSSR